MRKRIIPSAVSFHTSFLTHHFISSPLSRPRRSSQTPPPPPLPLRSPFTLLRPLPLHRQPIPVSPGASPDCSCTQTSWRSSSVFERGVGRDVRARTCAPQPGVNDTWNGYVGGLGNVFRDTSGGGHTCCCINPRCTRSWFVCKMIHKRARKLTSRYFLSGKSVAWPSNQSDHFHLSLRRAGWKGESEQRSRWC